MGRSELENVLAFEEMELVAAYEMRGTNQVRRADWMRAKTQVRDRLRTRFMRIVHEVPLRV